MKRGNRCPWAESGPGMIEYHDTKWGKPEHDERELFRMLILEGQQAGLSWAMIMRRIKSLDEAYDGFDPDILAEYDEKKIESLLENAKIIRNRLKIRSTVKNARAYQKLREECGGIDAYFWNFTDGRPIVNHPKTMEDVPTSTPLAEKISMDMKKRGFSFVGPVIIYSFMQAVGIVNDHLECCPYK